MRNLAPLVCFVLIGYLRADCSDLSYEECLYWAGYCEWNEEMEECQDIGGGDSEYGPYEYLSISQSDGMRDGPEYYDATLYYPIGAELPLKNIILGPGWGSSGSSISDWAHFFASYGFIATTIDYNDPINESHQDRAIAMLDLIETVRQENIRSDSPVFDQIDTNKFAAVGYSLSGGVTQLVAMLDSTLDAVIALNPTIVIEDCEGCANYDYCICLLPEHLDHNVPTLIISGENEIYELPDYEGLLGADQYFNTPENTSKMLYEISGGGHGSAAYPSSEFVQSKVLNWAKYHLMDSTDVCENLIQEPEDASQFLTTVDCILLPSFDINDDGLIDSSDFIILLDSVLNEYQLSISADFNFDSTVDIFDILIFSDYISGL